MSKYTGADLNCRARPPTRSPPSSSSPAQRPTCRGTPWGEQYCPKFGLQTISFKFGRFFQKRRSYFWTRFFRSSLQHHMLMMIIIVGNSRRLPRYTILVEHSKILWPIYFVWSSTSSIVWSILSIRWSQLTTFVEGHNNVLSEPKSSLLKICLSWFHQFQVIWI